MTPTEIDAEFKAAFAELVKKYGKYTIPYQEAARIADIARAKHVMLISQERALGAPARVMRDYGVPEPVIKELIGEVPEIEKKTKRADKYKSIFDWCNNNPGKETTVYEVAEVGGVSYATANQVVKDRIDYFKRVKKGLYIIRNPQQERAEEKL